ncbi:MAG: flagellar motor switch protein FliG [Desulfobacterales bacterium]|nr:flagellar motor switch protein FliG [Desulfobacterales bacterium]
MLDPQKLSGPEKAAILLLKMGESYSSEIFKRLTDTEIKRVATAMAKIDEITPETLGAVSEEFVKTYESEGKTIVEGENFLKKVVGSALDKNKADSIIKEVENKKRAPLFDWIRDVNVDTLASYISGEHPQTISMILAHLPSEISSEVLILMPDSKKADIALRLAKLGQVPEEIVREVDDAMRAELSGMKGGYGKGGGVKVLVDILTGVDKSTEDIIMESLEEEHSDMATDIREMMFVFEDLGRVDDRGIREILKKVEGPKLTLAMKTASEEMKNKIMGNLSTRAAEMLLEDLEVMGPVRLSDVETAQQEIVNIAKELEAEGTIILSKKGKEDTLV